MPAVYRYLELHLLTVLSLLRLRHFFPLPLNVIFVKAALHTVVSQQNSHKYNSNQIKKQPTLLHISTTNHSLPTPSTLLAV